MSYQKSDLWKTPNNDTIIWRYMKLDKFSKLLKQRALYFNNVLKYRETDDKSEGLIPTYNQKNMGNGYFLIDRIKTNNPSMKCKAINLMEHITCVNCWGIDKKKFKENGMFTLNLKRALQSEVQLEK